MTQYLLRVEAVNLDHFVYDTNKIQPTRGGSFLLLKSVQMLAGKKFKGVTLEKITTGASIGLYRFKAKDDKAAGEVAGEVQKKLLQYTGGHATFVVDCIEEHQGKFKENLLELQARNRWRQYQQPTLVLPAAATKEECTYDGIRPGTVGNDGKPVSDSVRFRMKRGKALRQSIYRRILEIKDPKQTWQFTDDLQELAADEAMGNLNGKIAFIYLDGNRFGRIREEKCGDGKTLASFGSTVEERRKDFLMKLLARASRDKAFKTEKEEIRLETLLWGGDELEMVVPAWKGWEVLKLFYKTTEKMEFDKVQLTHAGGIVFCGCKAPIREVRRMAHELAETTKKELRGGLDELSNIKHDSHDAFRFLVLKSFDTVGGSVGPFAERYYGKKAWEAMRLNRADMGNLEAAVAAMRTGGFPRNKIYDLVGEVRRGITYEQLMERIEAVLSGNEKKGAIVEGIKTFLGEEPGNPQRWFAVAELWDFVVGGGGA